MGGWVILGARSNRARAPERLPTMFGRNIQVEVLNASGRRGLARAAVRVLREAGFDVVYFGTGPDSLKLTQILSRRGDSTSAVKVARALGVGVVRVKTDTLLRLDVTAILGDDYKPPPGLRP